VLENLFKIDRNLFGRDPLKAHRVEEISGISLLYSKFH
jgi:hypothetical protein